LGVHCGYVNAINVFINTSGSSCFLANRPIATKLFEWEIINMKKAQTASDFENFKEVMITFVSNALSLNQGEKEALIENSSELSQQATLPDLIAHLTEKKVEISLIERLKEFGKNDAILENANTKILMNLS
jgi:hypothetical protein